MSKGIITIPKSYLLGKAKKEQEMIDTRKDENHYAMSDLDVMYHAGKRDAYHAVIEYYEMVMAEDESFLEEEEETQDE